MKKLFIKGVVLVALLFTGTTFAQDITGTSNEEINNYEQGFRLGFAVNGGIATDDYFSAALGGDVRLQYDLSQQTSLTLTSGYTHFFGKDEVKDLGIIPVKAGFKAFVWKNSFYVLGEAGAGFAVTNGYNDSSFLWSPGVGYANKFIDLSVRYEDLAGFDTGQVALRLAYGFKL